MYEISPFAIFAKPLAIWMGNKFSEKQKKFSKISKNRLT
jgi:hypothetical protein